MGWNEVRMVALVALVALLAACGAGTPAAPDSGVSGIVLIGPMCPVVQEGVPCPDRPFRATITVRAAGGEVVATARSAGNGRFRVGLAPGRYVLEAAPRDGVALPFAAPVAVRVRPHAYVRVTIAFDSGIR
jgi:hypothetical protein